LRNEGTDLRNLEQFSRIVVVALDDHAHAAHERAGGARIG